MGRPDIMERNEARRMSGPTLFQSTHVTEITDYYPGEPDNARKAREDQVAAVELDVLDGIASNVSEDARILAEAQAHMGAYVDGAKVRELSLKWNDSNKQSLWSNAGQRVQKKVMAAINARTAFYQNFPSADR